MKRAFREVSWNDDERELVERMNELVAEYQGMGLRMTLRQLYYRLVATNTIANLPTAYKRTGALLTKARYGGLVDWDAIEDRVRGADVPSEWDSVPDVIESAVRAFRLPRWLAHDSVVEVWVEKDAIANVLSPVADKFHVPFMVNRGYSSASAMHESALRLRKRRTALQDSKVRLSIPTFVLYLGDHDPSGEDMVRDVRDRLVEFGVYGLKVVKIALTRDQVSTYGLPPNPAKLSDSRSRAYVAEHGRDSWELDALPPDVLAQMVSTALSELIDESRVDQVTAMERRELAHFKKFYSAYKPAKRR